ncbi:hypothetical protein [Streptomyces sp. NPDC089799]|uniref:hypothetical protein n=1 Tax=Streptomyces sp. NPDC089799 TaxID=3155066 RepID=UPI0034163F20
MQTSRTIPAVHAVRPLRRGVRLAARAAALSTAALAAALCTGVSAQAADGDGIAGYQSARQTLRSDQTKDTVARFLVAARQQPGAAASAADGGTSGRPADAPAEAAAPPGFDLKDPVPLFEISPEFVAGKTRATPQTALRLTYLASRVAASDGHRAAVLLAPQGSAATTGHDGHAVGAEGWQLAGIRDGDADVSQAERGTPQARAFAEPQIGAWYRLTAEGTVESLNERATAGLGGKRTLSLAAYQKLVAARYGDKLPGSDYDRRGLAGGYGGLAQTDPAQPADAPADPPTTGNTATTTAASASGRPASDPSWQPAAGAGAALAAAVGAAVYVRRRNANGIR